YRLAELRFEAGDLGGISAAGAPRDVPDHVTVRAESMEQRPLREADLRRELGIGMQRVEVAREAIEQGLLGRRRLLDAEVGRDALRDLGDLLFARRRLSAEPAFTAEDDLRGGVEERLAARVLGHGVDED